MNSSSRPLQSTRVDLVGSMLRPQELKEAFAKYGEGQLGEIDLKTVQDSAIRDLVAKQVTHNLPIVVDGEFRRTSFMRVSRWSRALKSGRQG
jgi:5-methyltetrahydropteroyltriglutamate--homocysteine methyltransferase